MPISSLLFLFLFILSPLYALEPRSPEVIALMAVRDGLEDPRGVLKSWDEYSVDPCSFAMVTCSSDNLVVGLSLLSTPTPTSSFSSPFPNIFSSFSPFFFSGIPSQSLSGTLVSAIANLSNLRQVQLQDNNISGIIPPEIGALSKLQTLDLANNLLSGGIPESMGNLRSISYLRINNNTLSGDIPSSLAMPPLLALVDLSYNNLSGPLPGFSETTSVSVVGNPLICGRKDAAENRGCGFSTSLTPTPSPSPGGVLLKRIAVVVGISLGTIVIIITFIFTLLLWRRKHLYTQASISINDKEESEGLKGMGNLRSFTLRELQVSTEGFTEKNILGSGGFGNVYKGKLADGSVVAVKRLKDMGGTSGESQFRTELDIISLAVHRNLLPLIGYCATPTERLLVYPYMVNGSLASRLKGKPTLDWSRRKRIAVGAARGLVYLHEQCDPKIIHRDVKAANVLLDDSYEAVVGDFGLAKLMDHSESHVTTAVRGTVGHIAPEYLSTGQSSEKTDVFGFGILLLELISGMRGVDPCRTGAHKPAVMQWVRKMKEENAEMVADSEMEGEYDRGEVREMLKVAMACTENLPGKRPRMAEVVKMLEGGGEGMVERWAEDGPVREWKGESGGWKEESTCCILGRMVAEDEEDDEHSLDAFAMELSGPR